MVLGGHATASGSEKLTSVPPKSAVAQSVQKPAAKRAAAVSLSTPPRALAEERGGISESADAGADAVMSNLKLESVCARISFYTKSRSAYTRPCREKRLPIPRGRFPPTAAPQRRL